MLAFITSLRHPQNSADYVHVEQLLRHTLESVASQTCDDYVVLVVGNQEPGFQLPARTHFVEVNFPPPAPPSGPRTNRDVVIWDKGTKLAAGLLAAREFAPDYVMIFDSDDFVSNKLARFARSEPPVNGWVIRRGWTFSYTRGSVRPQANFNEVCGTSFLMNYAAYKVPDIPATSTQADIATAFGPILYKAIGAHRHAEKWFIDDGLAPVDLPFRGAVYNIDTGENHSGKKMAGIALPASRMLVREFGLPVDGSTVSRVWDAVGPRAVSHSMRYLLGRFARR